MDDPKVNRGGRPPTADPRKAWIMLRANSSERKTIETRFQSSQLTTLSEYLRTMAMEGKVIVSEPIADKQLLLSLSAVGNNYNQSAKRLNELALSADAVGDPRLAADIRRTLSGVENALAQLQPLIEGLLG